MALRDAGQYVNPLPWKVHKWVAPIDPLRGVAAFAVVVHHSIRQSFANPATAAQLFGNLGVTLFFVISGFCIHLPKAAKGQSGVGDFDWRGFYFRRARRLLPTHYAALLLSAAMGLFIQSALIDRPTPGNFVAHVVMAHVWYGPFYYSINQVFWSIAIEVHLYLAYPIFLSLRRKLNGYLPLALLIVGFATHLAASIQLQGGWRWVGQHFFLTYWWQWALGAYLADVYVSGRTRWWTGLILGRWSWLLWAAVSLAMGLVYRTLLYPRSVDFLSPIPCFLLLGSLVMREDRATIPWLAYMGSFSYSMYLIHQVAICIMVAVLSRPQGTLQFFLYLAVSVIAGWLFFLAVERHFLSGKQREHEPKMADLKHASLLN